MKKQIVRYSFFLIILGVIGFIAISSPAQKTESMSDTDKALYKEGINPADTLLEEGEAFLSSARGAEGKSCTTCHANPSEYFKGVAATYPKITKSAKTMVSLQKQINVCIETFDKGGSLSLGSHEMTAMTTYIKSLSNGMPVNVKIDGEAKEWYDLGKLVFSQRRGQRNLSCKVCHDILPGRTLRMQKLAPIGAASTHWPAYRMTKGKTFIIEQRFRQCMKNARMKRLKAGSDPMVALELFITHKSQGKKVSVPGWVR